MHTRARPQNFFETRSVLLFAALTMGGNATLQARAAEPAPARPATTTPATRHPAMAQLKPPQTLRADSTQPAPEHAAFDRADTNRDGELSPSEAQRLPAISERFTQIDTNHDGQLSRQEFDTGSHF
ncbi:MAG: EF-hand domain-containing protein [Giesbergeria sp.]